MAPLSPLTEELLAQLDMAEKVALLSGRDVWRTTEIERVGIGSVKVTDGPNGARGDGSTGTRAVCLPAAIGLGASFDPDLVVEVGRLLGRETRRRGAHVLLAPTINLARHPLGGRNFESFGEDPHLAAELAVAYVGGVQSEGVGACAKHFVANDVEYARMTVSAEVDEAVLREVYLAPFEAVVEAGVWTVMASYPKLNGTHCTEHPWLLTTVLREEWGFDGLVMSDWGATHHRSRPVLAGLDLEMPGPPVALGADLAEAVATGEVPVSVLDQRAARVLELAARAGRVGAVEEEPERSVDLDEERQLARRAAVEGMVLLTNDGTLPLSAAELESLAVIGPNAAAAVIQGGGSARVRAHRSVSPVDGLRAALGPERISYHRGCTAHRYLPPVPSGAWAGEDRPVRVDLFGSDDLAGEPLQRRTAPTIAAFVHGPPPAGAAAQRWTGRLPIGVTGSHSFSVLAVGRSRVIVNGDEIVDNWTSPRPGDAFFQMASAETIGEVELEAGTVADVVVEWAHEPGRPLAGLRFGHLPPLDEDALIEEAEVAAAGADAAIVVVGLDAEWESEGHDRVVYGLPRRQDELIRRVAAVNDRTVVVVNAGAPVDAGWIDDVSATLMAWYPGQEFGHALADVLLGVSEPGGRLPLTWPRRLADHPFELPVPEPGPPRPGAQLPYSEGRLIGHRSYDRSGVEPLAPFGFGLGYTSFRLDPPAVVGSAGPSGATSLTVPVTNDGDRAGKCVVQVYLEAAEGWGPEYPAAALAGFAAVRADAGETVEARITVPARAFARWDEATSVWVDPGGRRRLRVGLSSRLVVHAVTVDRAQEDARER